MQAIQESMVDIMFKKIKQAKNDYEFYDRDKWILLDYPS